LKDKIFDIVKPLTWRPSRLFDWLDGGKNFKGVWHRIFYDNPKGARANQIRRTNARKESFNNKIKSLGISLWDLSKMREVNGIRYSIQEMIGVYMASKNERSRMALNFGMQIEDADINAIIKAMTPQEIAIGDFLLADYETNHPRLRRSVVEQENRDMGKEENYSPIRREGVNYTTLASEFIDDVIHRDTIRRHTPAKGMTIQRKNVPPSLQTKIRLDAINIWNEQVEKQERYIYMGPVVRHMNKVMANRNLRNVVAERFGNQVVEYISGQQGYISRVANPYIYRQFSDIEKISGKLRRNTAVAYLAYNLVTMGKQLPSAFLYMADAGPSHLLASAIDFATNPRAMIEKTRDLDPELKNRSIERELEELRSTHNGNLLKQKITEVGMEGIYLFDTVARTIGWNAVYQRAITNEESQGEAIRLARNATLRTQPAAAAEDLPALYVTSEFLNWFTMFTNQLNQIYNIATYDIPSYIKNEQYGDAALQMFGMSTVALVIWVVTSKRLPEEPEDFAEAISEQAINMLPLLGKPIMAARKGWKSDIPIFEAVKRIVNSMDDLDITRTDTKAMAEAIAVMTGIPYTAIRRAIEAIEEEEPTTLLGVR
jgi:transcriptional regulator NrdR family protein